MPTSSPRGRVVVLAGPSGAGKSRLAGRLRAAYGWPVVRLDNFYRDGRDPALPMTDFGDRRVPDWDDPRSWDGHAAVAALVELAEHGRATVPRYDLATSAVVGADEVVAEPTDLVLAEGIFAAEIVPALRERGMLAAAYCVTHGRHRTFLLRLTRDLREHRKPPALLVRRGVELWRREPRIVARARSLGARCLAPEEVERELATRLVASGPS